MREGDYRELEREASALVLIFLHTNNSVVFC